MDVEREIRWITGEWRRFHERLLDLEGKAEFFQKTLQEKSDESGKAVSRFREEVSVLRSHVNDCRRILEGETEPTGGSQMPKDRSGRNENESHESKMSRAWESQRKRDNENDKREGRDVRAGDALRKHYQDKGDMPEDR